MSTQFNYQKHFYFKLFKQLYITIQFSVSTVPMSKTVQFQIIQFSISTQFKCKYSLVVKNFFISNYSVQIQLIQFSISTDFVYTQLHVKAMDDRKGWRERERERERERAREEREGGRESVRFDDEDLFYCSSYNKSCQVFKVESIMLPRLKPTFCQFFDPMLSDINYCLLWQRTPSLKLPPPLGCWSVVSTGREPWIGTSNNPKKLGPDYLLDVESV